MAFACFTLYQHLDHAKCESLLDSKWINLLLQVRVDDFEKFGGMKGFGEGADGAESFRVVEYLWTAVRGDQKNRNLWLQTAQI